MFCYKQALDFHKPLKILCHTLELCNFVKITGPHWTVYIPCKKVLATLFSILLRSCSLAHSTPDTLRQESNHFFSSLNSALFSFLFLFQMLRYFYFFLCYKCRIIFFLFVLQIPRYFRFFFCYKFRFLLVSFHISFVPIFLLLFV
jgi:hypothetical protein